MAISNALSLIWLVDEWEAGLLSVVFILCCWEIFVAVTTGDEVEADGFVVLITGDEDEDGGGGGFIGVSVLTRSAVDVTRFA